MHEVRKLRQRLVDLQKRFKGRFYWRNGVIRHQEFRPTKGWRDRRWESFPVPTLRGFCDADALGALLAEPF